MLKLMAQVLTGGGLRRRDTDPAPALLPEPAPEKLRDDDDTALLPAYPPPPPPPRLGAQSWAEQLVVPSQAASDLDPYGRHTPRPRRGYPA